MIIGSFNIRGGGSVVKRRRICQIIKKGNADIFHIQETKFGDISVLLVIVSGMIIILVFLFWLRWVRREVC